MVGIADQDRRLADLNLRAVGINRIIAERAAAYADDPCGRTGLYTRRCRIRRSREYPVLVEEYRLDVGLLRALLRIQRQAARELGQLGKKNREQTGPSPSIEELIHAGRARIAKLRARQAAAQGATPPDEAPGWWAAPAGGTLPATSPRHPGPTFPTTDRR